MLVEMQILFGTGSGSSANDPSRNFNFSVGPRPLAVSTRRTSPGLITAVASSLPEHVANDTLSMRVDL
jgi:hypothetical protein